MTNIDLNYAFAEIASVIAPYTASGQEQLSLHPGQLIQVRKKSASGWWEGELQARGQKKKIGWFPANYVKLLGSSARSTPNTEASMSPSPQLTQSSASSPAFQTDNYPATQTSATPTPQANSAACKSPFLSIAQR